MIHVRTVRDASRDTSARSFDRIGSAYHVMDGDLHLATLAAVATDRWILRYKGGCEALYGYDWVVRAHVLARDWSRVAIECPGSGAAPGGRDAHGNGHCPACARACMVRLDGRLRVHNRREATPSGVAATSPAHQGAAGRTQGEHV